jgi:hypothetical protein
MGNRWKENSPARGGDTCLANIIFTQVICPIFICQPHLVATQAKAKAQRGTKLKYLIICNSLFLIIRSK